MDQLNADRQTIEKVLTEYAAIPYAYGDFKTELIISKDENHYILITSGWQSDIRTHGCIVHLQIIDDKIWIQRDGTEDGIALDLVAAGIPKSRIVLGFHPTEIRKHTEYAIN